MSSSRRDWLKCFGVGAMIAPVVAGTPALDTVAKIIEPPKLVLPDAPVIRPASLNDMSTLLREFGEWEMNLQLKNTRTGEVRYFDARCAITRFNVQMEWANRVTWELQGLVL